MSSSSRDALFGLLAPAVRDNGLDLEDLEVQPAGRRRLLHVIVDRDGGVSLDDVAAVSTAVSGLLDATDAMGGTAYVLEVTSPGVDRPLTEPRHWRRARGRVVAVPVRDAGELVGRVLDADDDGVRLDVQGVARSMVWDDIGRGRVQVEFSRRADQEA